MPYIAKGQVSPEIPSLLLWRGGGGRKIRMVTILGQHATGTTRNFCLEKHMKGSITFENTCENHFSGISYAMINH